MTKLRNVACNPTMKETYRKKKLEMHLKDRFLYQFVFINAGYISYH